MVEAGPGRVQNGNQLWQFMSADLRQHPGKVHRLTDDLESFPHILGWMTLRYARAINSYGTGRRGRDLCMFDENYEEDGV